VGFTKPPRRHVVDHALPQRADGLSDIAKAPVSHGVEPRDLRQAQDLASFSALQITQPSPATPYRASGFVQGRKAALQGAAARMTGVRTKAAVRCEREPGSTQVIEINAFIGFLICQQDAVGDRKGTGLAPIGDDGAGLFQAAALALAAGAYKS
jgi:hypothetical protein